MYALNTPRRKNYLLRPLYSALLAVLIVISLGAAASGAQAKGSAMIYPAKANNAYDLIAAVNQLRASNGLPALKTNGALMAAAQGHSDFQAANNTASHSGAGGSTPKSRAMAAGYGGGMDVSVTENIYTGSGASPQQAVQWWQGDGPHLSTMLHKSATDIGAGMATSGGSVYYTLLVGYLLDSPASNPTQAGAPPAGKTPAPSKPASTLSSLVPVQAEASNPDGSIVHEVQQGQALWNIAAIYGVSVDDLLRLNKLTQNSFIRPGDKILVRAPQVELTQAITTTLSASATADLPPVTPTRRPTRTPISTPVEAAALPQADNPGQPSVSAPQPSSLQAASEFDPLLILIGALVLGGAALVILGYTLKRGA